VSCGSGHRRRRLSFESAGEGRGNKDAKEFGDSGRWEMGDGRWEMGDGEMEMERWSDERWSEAMEQERAGLGLFPARRVYDSEPIDVAVMDRE